MADDSQMVGEYEVHYHGDDDDKTDKWISKDGTANAKFANGDVYSGDYKDQKRHGKGVYTWSNGARYEGSYSHGLKSGLGTLQYPDKSRYVGEWMDDKRHGQGTLYFPNGDRFVGAWEADQRTGQGTYIYQAEAAQLTGTWENGQCKNGVLTTADGSKFVCPQWVDNKPVGPGSLVFVSSGLTQSGVFRNGSFEPLDASSIKV